MPVPEQETSIELVQRASRGDRAALESLLRRYVPLLRRWASGRLPRWTREMVDTEDMVQDVMFRTVRGLERFEPRGTGALQAYMRQALHNRIADEVRRARRRPQRSELDTDHEDGAPSPLVEAIGNEAHARYEAALERLSPQDRALVTLRVELGLDYSRIALELNRPSPEAARMAVSRALLRLAREMGRG